MCILAACLLGVPSLNIALVAASSPSPYHPTIQHWNLVWAHSYGITSLPWPRLCFAGLELGTPRSQVAAMATLLPGVEVGEGLRLHVSARALV